MVGALGAALDGSSNNNDILRNLNDFSIIIKVPDPFAPL